MLHEAVKGKKILIVEDDDGGRLALTSILNECEASVTSVTDAEDGIAAIQAELPDLVISDINLPGMDGYYFIQKLREFECKMGADPAPAIALTAYVGAEHQLRSMGEGFQRHIVKPVDPAELLSVLDGLLGGPVHS
jgi:CheY-like chemotaxis protein